MTTSRRSPGNGSLLFAVEARRQLASGDARRAIETCKMGLARHPEHAAGYVVLAAAYRSVGQGDRARLVLMRGFERTRLERLRTLAETEPGGAPSATEGIPTGAATTEGRSPMPEPLETRVAAVEDLLAGAVAAASRASVDAADLPGASTSEPLGPEEIAAGAPTAASQIVSQPAADERRQDTLDGRAPLSDDILVDGENVAVPVTDDLIAATSVAESRLVDETTDEKSGADEEMEEVPVVERSVVASTPERRSREVATESAARVSPIQETIEERPTDVVPDDISAERIPVASIALDVTARSDADVLDRSMEAETGLGEPDAPKPEIDEPAPQRPEAEPAPAERPEQEAPNVERPEVETPTPPDAGRPEIDDPAIERPEVERTGEAAPAPDRDAAASAHETAAAERETPSTSQDAIAGDALPSAPAEEVGMQGDDDERHSPLELVEEREKGAEERVMTTPEVGSSVTDRPGERVPWYQRRTPRTSERGPGSTLALHSGKSAHRLTSANLRLIPGLEFAPLRAEEQGRRMMIAPIMEEPLPDWEPRRRPSPIEDAPPLPEFPSASPTTESPVTAEAAAPPPTSIERPSRPNGPEPTANERLDESDEGISLTVDDAADTSAIDELARRLEGARIAPVGEVPTGHRPAFEPSIVSDTLADILVAQGAYGEAMKAFMTLARTRPTKVTYYEERIAEMKRRLLSERGGEGS